jgi:hypothetical protein
VEGRLAESGKVPAAAFHCSFTLTPWTLGTAPMYILYSYSQVKSSVVATYSHSFDPNVVPPSVVWAVTTVILGLGRGRNFSKWPCYRQLGLGLGLGVRDPRQVAEGSIDTEPGLSGTDSLTFNNKTAAAAVSSTAGLSA